MHSRYDPLSSKSTPEKIVKRSDAPAKDFRNSALAADLTEVCTCNAAHKSKGEERVRE
jgi:hypothetical protein